MARYRKKPVEIEARQIDTADYDDICEIVTWSGGRAVDEDEERVMAIDTLEGTMYAGHGDWIIRGVKGEFYPCKPDIFEATYEDANTTPRSIRVVFEPTIDELSGETALCFVEIENERGESINAGTWHDGDGWRWLTIDLSSVVEPQLRGGFVP